jgi:tetratricopeptide (TPR) repeat protein
MYNKGVKFLAGTDFPNPYRFPGFSLHDELNLLVKGGLPELGALKTATLNGAEFMGKEEEFGTVEVGKLASLVLLNRNPLLDIENTKSIETVILRGEVFNRKALDKMLEQAKFRARNKPYSDWLREKIPSIGLEQAMDSLDILMALDKTVDLIDKFDFNILGFEYMGSEDFKTAKRIFRKNIELFPDSWDIYDSYAEACLKDNDFEQSLDLYQKSLIINPDNKNAENMIDSVKLLIQNNQDIH